MSSAFKGTRMNPIPGRNPYRFGEIPEFPVGSMWPGRRQLCDDGVHANLTKGIHGRGQEGAFSVVLSGGYEDDVDLGEEFTYTGEGGQPKRSEGAKWESMQVTDQEWKYGNLSLQTSSKTKKPVRVIRGHRLKSEFAPAEGYRYDGLYTVVEATMKMGKSHHAVCLFRFVRCPGQLPLPTKIATLAMQRERPMILLSAALAAAASLLRQLSPDRVASTSTTSPRTDNQSSRKTALLNLPFTYKIPKHRPEPAVANYKSSRPQSSPKVPARASSHLSLVSSPAPSVSESSSLAISVPSSQTSSQGSVYPDLHRLIKEEPDIGNKESTLGCNSEDDEDDDMYVKEEETLPGPVQDDRQKMEHFLAANTPRAESQVSNTEEGEIVEHNNPRAESWASKAEEGEILEQKFDS